MVKQITKMILIIYLMPSIITQEKYRKNPFFINLDPNDESRQNVIEEIRDSSANTKVLNDELTSTQVVEPKEQIGYITKLLAKEQNKREKLIEKANNLNQTDKYLANIESEKTKIINENKSNNSDNVESEDDKNSSEPFSQDTDLDSDRLSIDKQVKSTLNEKGAQATEKKNKLNNSDLNTELINTRLIKDEGLERLVQEDLIDTRPNLDVDKLLGYFKSIGKNNSNKYKSNLNAVKIVFNTEQVKKDKFIHAKHSLVSDKDFAYMAAIVKGGKYVCAGALIDDSWVLTAANGNHLTRETIRFFRVRLGSINFKKGGKLLPIKYYETHPYFNSSKPDYDLALLMLSKPVRFTVNIRPIRLQLTQKDVLATHFIVTSWHVNVQPGLNQSSVIKHHRILSVAHLHPTYPEDCLQELKEMGASRDSVMCLEGGTENTCVRATGAPIVINGVLWGIISSWKPLDCDEDTSTLAALVSGRNTSSWLHGTVHGHKWHPE